MRFEYHPSIDDYGLICEDLIDKDNGNITVASDVEEGYQPLMKAAPDLLEACKAASNFWIDPPDNYQNYHKLAKEVTRKIALAIAKAEA